MVSVRSRKDIKKSILVDYMATRQVTKDLMIHLSVQNERELLDKLDCDFYYLSCRDISQNETVLPFYKGPVLDFTESDRKCPLGIQWKRMVYDDKFGCDECITGPLSDESLTIQDILNYEFPKPEWFDFSPLIKECESFKDKIIVGGLWSAIHGDSFRMMGFENYLLNIACNKPLVKTLIDRMTDFFLTMNKLYFETLKGKTDIYFMGNDFGTQNGLMISEADWKELFYDNYKKLIDLAHSYGLLVMVHSCGSIEPLIPHFIKLGVDILDPVQVTASDMNSELLGKKYSKSIYFHGAVDTQNVLPYGNPGEVKEHVFDLIDNFNKYGTYIICPSNNFMSGTPSQNITMVYDTAKEYNAVNKI
jgi:uroporphyrinogen decarboxylase